MIFFYLGAAVLSCVSCRNSTVGMIKEIGINPRSRYYPKHYITPKRWMRNIFHIKQRVIPRYEKKVYSPSIFWLVMSCADLSFSVFVLCTVCTKFTLIPTSFQFFALIGSVISIVIILALIILIKRKK